MTPKQETAIRQHGENLQGLFPKTRDVDPISLCRRLRRIEGQAERAAVDACNGVIDSEEWERESENILRKVRRILGDGPEGHAGRVFINGDPRGYALKINWSSSKRRPPIHCDWGGYGIIAPEIGPNG